MLYREIIAVCSQIHTKHINTLCGQNVELLNVKLPVHIVIAALYSSPPPLPQYFMPHACFFRYYNKLIDVFLFEKYATRPPRMGETESEKDLCWPQLGVTIFTVLTMGGGEKA